MFVTSLVQHVDLSNPFGEKRSWAIYFCAQFYPTPTLHSQVNRRWRSSGRKMQRCLNRAHDGDFTFVGFSEPIFLKFK